MNEKLIKSTVRVKDWGEVFTPQKTVNLMLDQPEIQAKIQDITSTFLEPAAGEGAFLVELLKRKIKVAKQESKTANEFGENCLIALSTLYGIEIMEDNVEMLVMNMILTFEEIYSQILFADFSNSKPKKNILKSAQTIIKANIAQGDTLKGITANGKPIIFSEWKIIKERPKKVKRLEYTFESILNGSRAEKAQKKVFEEIDLFASYNGEDKSQKKETKKEYATVKWSDIYKEELE